MKKLEVPKFDKATFSKHTKFDTRKLSPDYILPRLANKIMQMLGNTPQHIRNAYQKSKGESSGWSKFKAWIAKEMMK